MKNKMAILLFICLLALSGSCFAMTFSQPVEIGKLTIDFGGRFGYGYIIEGATYNNVDYYKKFKKNTSYGKGLAQFGKGTDSIFVHYDVDSGLGLKVGSKDTNNVIPLFDHSGGIIYQVKTDDELILYPIGYGLVSGDYIIIGKRADGKFVKYVDTSEITKRYFGTDVNLNVFYNKISFDKDQIIIPYVARYVIQRLPVSKYETKEGEFRFKWDDAAQWFGIEQVVY